MNANLDTKTSDFFLELTPDHILTAVENIGQRSTGRFLALNSLENRVYEVELEDNSRVVGKFYRPNRWSRECILEEHEFLKDLSLAEVPVVSPLALNDGSTLGLTPEGISYAVFPKVRGRAPEELTDAQLTQLGRYIARIHNVGALKKSHARLSINPQTFGTEPLKFLLEKKMIPLEVERSYRECVENIIDLITPLFLGVETLRLHGDCHLGNLLYDNDSAFFLDFDDMVEGPAIQDLWLLAGGRSEQDALRRNTLLSGYKEMRDFDNQSSRLTEPLRALRIIHYSAWVAKRWSDPAFPRAFPDFQTHKYWSGELLDLQRQLEIIRSL
jgi:Ser/Thr protein kinase RdoA (MazF antagonist)